MAHRVRRHLVLSTLSVEERARRQAAIDFARASVRLEGFALNDAAEQLNRRYIHGEITRAQHTAALLELANRSVNDS